MVFVCLARSSARRLTPSHAPSLIRLCLHTSAIPLEDPACIVWGANTGVGKTLISAGLARAAVRAQVRTAPFYPDLLPPLPLLRAPSVTLPMFRRIVYLLSYTDPPMINQSKTPSVQVMSYCRCLCCISNPCRRVTQQIQTADSW